MPSDNPVLAALGSRGDQTAMRWKRYGVWQTISAQTMVARVNAIAHGLRNIGFETGAVAGIIGDNCAEWVLADLAIVAAGGVSAGFDPQSDDIELARVLNETQARVLFVAGDVQLHKALTARGRCPHLQTIVVMHQQWDDGTNTADAMPLADLESRGTDQQPLSPRKAEDAAVIIYSSAMTGDARGAVSSARAIALQAERAAKALALTADDERLSLIPLHHVLERVVGIYASLLAGTIINFSESRDTAIANMVELQPTVILAPPQLWARLKGGVELAMLESTDIQRWACRKAFAARNAITDALVLAPIRRRIGLGRARLCLSGGAPMRNDVADWFGRLARPLTDIYGHAETAGAVALRGVAIEGHTLDVDADGHLHVRSDTLALRYASAPDALGAVWPSQDIAEHNGNALRIQGRRHHVSPSGAAPFATERALIASPFIADAFVEHDQAGRAVARILIESDAVVKYAQDRSIPFTHFLSLCRSDDIRALIGGIVDSVSAAGPIAITRFTLIERALGPEDREVSPVMALRRHRIRDTDDDRAQDTAHLSMLETTQP
jgi:long-chain acyl-CoA synthetase